jgi:hypothetical protein
MALSGTLSSKAGSQERSDLVAFWSVPLLDGVHTVEFEHGGTTGKRVIRVDGKVRFQFSLRNVDDGVLSGDFEEGLDVQARGGREVRGGKTRSEM